MTVREAYEGSLLEVTKHKTASFYPEDFTYYFNKAVQNKINKLYALYERNQQLSDDLQNIYRHIIINLDDSVPYPLNITYPDGSPFVRFEKSVYLSTNSIINFPTWVVSGLNTSSIGPDYKFYSDNTVLGEINNNIIVQQELPWGPPLLVRQLDQLVFESIDDGVILKLEMNVLLNDYRMDNNTNYLEFGFNLNSHSTLSINPITPAYFKYNSSTKMFDLIEDKGFKIINETKILLKAPNDYLHLLGLDNILTYRNNPECEKTFEKLISLKRLTADTLNTIESNPWLATSLFRGNNYFKETNNLNSTAPDFIIEYCSDKEKKLVSLDKVEMQYLKIPQKYVLLDSDLNGSDNTAEIEFQEYMCHEFVEETVILFLEKHTNPRLQTYIPVNDTNKRSREEN